MPAVCMLPACALLLAAGLLSLLPPLGVPLLLQVASSSGIEVGQWVRLWMPAADNTKRPAPCSLSKKKVAAAIAISAKSLIAVASEQRG